MTTTKRLPRVNLNDVKAVEAILHSVKTTGRVWDLTVGCVEAEEILPSLRAEIVALRKELKSMKQKAAIQGKAVDCTSEEVFPMTPFGRCLVRL